MNKTFKVVFNKVRGAFVAVNEATSSVQKKGTKTVLAVAAAMVAGGVAAADDTTWQKDYEGKTFQASNYITGEHTVTGALSAVKGWQTGVPGNYFLINITGPGAKLDATDADFSLKTTTPDDNKTQLQSLGVSVGSGGSLNLLGQEAKITVETNAYGTNHSNVTALYANGGTVAVSANRTDISVKSTRANGKAVYGVSAGSSGSVTFSGSAVNITLDTATNRDVEPNNINHRGEAIGIDVYGKSKVTTGAGTTVTIKVKGTGNMPVNLNGTYPTGASNVYGVVAEGGVIDLAGINDITVTSNAGVAKGIRVTDASYTMTGGESSGEGAVTLGGPTTISVTSTSGDVYGVDASEFNLPSGTQVNEAIALNANGPLTIKVSSGEKAKAVGIAVNDKAIVNLNGKTTITAKHVLSGNGTVNLADTLVANGSLEDFTGNLNIVSGGSFTLTANHGKLAKSVINVVGGELTGSTGVLFTTTDTSTVLVGTDGATVKVAANDSVVFNQGVTATSGTVVVSDQGYYTVDTLQAMSGALNNANITLRFESATLYKKEGESAKLIDNIIQENEQVTATSAGTQNGQAYITANSSGAQSVVVDAGSDQPSVTSAMITGKGLTLVGSDQGGALISAKADTTAPIPITVGNGGDSTVVTLGSSATATRGELDDVTVSDNGKLAVENIAAKARKLTTASEAKVTIGTNDYAGKLDVTSLDMSRGGSIFLDPAVFGGVYDASHFAAEAVEGIIAGEIVAGRNSIISLGATSDVGAAAVEKMLGLTGKTWGTDVTAAVYIGSAVSVDSNNGYLVADGSLTQANFTSAQDSGFSAGTVTVADKGLLAVNQGAATGTDPLVNGPVAFKTGSTLGIVNADEGKFTLASTVTDATNARVVTDNPFLSGKLDGTFVTMTFEADEGLKAIASTGIQAMTRRADFTMAQTIADRASVDQELEPGMNLWVDLAGETYKSDDLDHGGDFEADVFYGAFGGDVKVADDYTVGAAFQYGTGTLRSGVSNIKNAIDNYGLSLYGTAKYGSAKILGELAYVWGENDITSAQTALNGSVDTTMYSAGVTGMYELQAGGFTFVPSIGVRVSQLETDAMQVGAFRVEDQDQTLVQIPIALRINGADLNAGGWKFAPSFKIAYVPTFGDKEIEVLGHETDVIDTNPVQVDFGLRAGTENLLVNAAFAVGAGHNGTSSVGGKVGIKYAF